MSLFRKNVAIVVINHEGKILLCRRADRVRAWQIPQGGVEEGESSEEALYRELEEEIGTADVTLLGKLPTPIAYRWPEHLQSERAIQSYRAQGFVGQEQSYFLVRLNRGATINLAAHVEPEFDRYEWVTKDEFFSRVAGFKEEAYRTALSHFDTLLPGVIS
jgi:putative (di)nucleoside polyphosphate hydrolase